MADEWLVVRATQVVKETHLGPGGNGNLGPEYHRMTHTLRQVTAATVISREESSIIVSAYRRRRRRRSRSLYTSRMLRLLHAVLHHAA